VANLGENFTFQNHFSYYYLLGISFGCSNNLMDYNNIDFVNSNIWRKLARAILASVIIIP
jgi:hypothetical protein